MAKVLWQMKLSGFLYIPLLTYFLKQMIFKKIINCNFVTILILTIVLIYYNYSVFLNNV